MVLNAGEVSTIVVNEIVADYLSATSLMMNIQGK